MNLLAPWFLAGLALLAGPVIAHLIRRATRQRVGFSSLRFLPESRPRLEQRSRVQHPWLLALRCLILAVLALAFARPYLADRDVPLAAARASRHVVVILDESASMQRTGLWSAARDRVMALVEPLHPGDHFVLLGAGEQVRERVSLERWQAALPAERAALVSAALSELEPGWGPTPLDAAVDAALEQWEAMAESDGGAAERLLVMVSDFAAGSRIAGLASVAWPDRVQVQLEPVRPQHPANASVQWLGWTPSAQGEPTARVRVNRSFDIEGTVQWQLFDAGTGASLGPPEPLDLLPGSTQVLTFPWPEGARRVRLELAGDREPFDNQLWIVRPEARELDVSYVGQQPLDDPQHAPFFIQRAVAGWSEPQSRLVAAPAAEVQPGLIVVDGLLDEAGVTAIRARLQAGSFGLVLLRPSGSGAGAEGERGSVHQPMVDTAARLAGESGWRAIGSDRGDALLGQMDFRHPLFAPFADPLYSDFTRVRFWQPRSVELPPASAAAVVARFDDGSPAVLELAVGAGRLVVWGGDWTPTASQWVLSSKFVPFLQALVERAAGGGAPVTMAEVGDAATARLVAPVAPGIHLITDGGRPRELAVNVPAGESRLDPLPLDVWEQLGVPLSAPESPGLARQREQQQRLQNAVTLEREQRLWRPLLWAALIFLAAESLLARLLAHRPREPATAAHPA